MKTTRLQPAIFILAMILSCFALPEVAQAQSSQDITNVLTTGYWHVVPGKAWHVFRFDAGGVFDFGTIGTDGAFTRHAKGGGTWKITVDSVVMMSESNEVMYTWQLPIVPAGTAGTDSTGQTVRLMCSTASTTTTTAAGSDDTPAPRKRKKKAGGGADDETAQAGFGSNPAAPTPTPVIAAGDQQAAASVIQTYHNSLVFVTGADAAGSGFIATIANGTFLVTNAHVAAGIRDAQFKTLDGTAVQGGTPSIAVGEDIFCMALPAGGKPLPVMKNVDQNAAIGDSVAVLGNAEGGGVVNTIIGKIVGIGPNLVEVDAPFVPGNSGSPIVHLKSGQVIGVATYSTTQEYDLTTSKKLPQPVVRRFGYRLDSIKAWQAVDQRAFDAQAIQMESIEKLTDDLADFLNDIGENNGVVTMGRHTNPVIATRIDQWVAEKSHNPSAEDIAEADANFLSFLKIACRSDVNAAQQTITYDYFRRDLSDQKQARDEMAKDFDQIIKAEGQ
jgi:hypothetical protein